jgi:hypothetical protein
MLRRPKHTKIEVVAPKKKNTNKNKKKMIMKKK